MLNAYAHYASLNLCMTYLFICKKKVFIYTYFYSN